MSTVPLPTWLQTSRPETAYLKHPAWLEAYRAKQWDAFCQQGLPTRKQERWKYADLSLLANKNYVKATRVNADDFSDAVQQHRLRHGNSILLVFINGYFMPTLSDLNKLPQEVMACNLQDAWQQQEATVKAHWPAAIDAAKYPFASLNAATFTDGLFFYLPDNIELIAPIHVLSLIAAPHEFITHPFNVFVLGAGSKMTMIEEYFAFAEQPYFMNIVNHITLGSGAQLEQYKIQTEDKQAIHLAHTFVEQKQNSNSYFVNFSAGSLFARDELVVQLQEPGADCRTSGFYRLEQDQQYIDHHVDINHAAPRSHSEMLYKGIIDKRARAVFNGRLHVAKDAQKIMAYQANHNLLLSKEAEVYAKPELEIYADDVKCKHGATIGQLDQDALFYLRSRGITREEALSILLQGFADEIVQRVTHEGIKMRVQEVML